MPVPNEGTANLPSDNSGRFIIGAYNDATGFFYALRQDNITAKNLRAALYDAAGNALLVATNPGSVTNREGASSFNAGQVSVTSTATLVHAATPTRTIMTVYNTGSVDFYAGPAGVTTGTGFLIKAGASYDFKHNQAVYGITATGSTAVCFHEEVV